MQKKRLLLILLMALFAPLAAQAYNHQVQVGNGTSGQTNAPINLYYNYSYTQQIYTAAQINGDCSLPGEIESISFYYAGSTTKTHPIVVFMKTTSKSAFSSTTDWETVTADDIVYNANWTVSTAGWVTIPFSKTFTYDGESNLLIAIDKGYGDNYSSLNFNYTTASANQVIYYRNDSTDPDPYNPTTATGTTANLPNIIFNMTLAHPVPTAITLDDVAARTATLSWTAPNTTNTVTGYAYEYTDGETTQTGTATGTTANLTGLTTTTDYLFQVKAVYADGESCWSDVFEFSTLEDCPTPRDLEANNVTANSAEISWLGSVADSYTVEYLDPANATISGYTQGTVTVLSEGFEGGSMPTGWSATGSYWKVGSGTGNSSYTGSATGSYNATCYINTGSSTTDMLITPAMDLSTATSATLSFNFRNVAWGSDINEFHVYYRVNSGSWNEIYSNLSAQASWTTTPITVNLTGFANNYQIGFECKTGSSSWSYGYGLGIDDVEVVAEMSVPQYVWNTASTNATNPYILGGLEPETTYNVRVFGVCGGVPGNPSETLTFSTIASCPTPQNLAVTTDGATATATWTGTANTYNIEINGTLSTDNPITGNTYTFNVDLSTTYTVRVQANCDGGETSEWTDPVSVTTPPCVGGHEIAYTLTDSYGDGWNGASITFIEGCEQTTLTVSASSNSGTLTVCGNYFAFIWNSGSYDSECSFTFTEGGTTLFTKPSPLSDGQVLYTIGTQIAIPTALTEGTITKNSVELGWTENGTATAWEICVNGDETHPVPANTNPFTLTGLTPDTDYTIKVRSTDGANVSCWTDEITIHTEEACAKPTDLDEANISYTTADLSWTGTSDSYVVQYGTWTQAGTDHQATDELVPYTFDLSSFSGKGTVAIRHYNVTDMFYLNVDDIVVKDANGTTVYSQDFESGSIPSNMSNIDLDGDGYVWSLAQSTNMTVNGSYGVFSASWYDGDALTPDNWLVISNIQLGGSITFSAVGQDPSVPYENFAVYVIADNQFTEAYSGTNTSCQVTGLTEGTPYVWRVKGVCDEDPSSWVSSMFKTNDDLLVFANDGAWDRISNWTDADGNAVGALPTIENKVRIDADANVASGVVATAKSVVLNGGSIEIEEGGQLKQGGSVKVTMHKGITGYGAGNEEAADHYYFIATPHSCSYLEENTLFPYVLNVTDGNYDLYAFDPTQELEWINYEYDSEHSEFHTGNNTGLFNKKGYLYANETNKDLVFVGTVSSSLNNTLTDSYTYNSTSTDDFNGWRLVGNPFTCDAYINYVDGEGTVLEADFYTMNNDGDGYDLTSSSVALAPLTGALVNYSATGTIQFSSEEPAKVNRTGMLNMNVSRGNKAVSQARLRFGQGHNLGSMCFRNGSKVYMPIEGKDYAVVYTENQGEMPFSFKAENNGTYTLSFNAEDVTFGYLHLIDNMTGNDVDLLSTPSYTFEARTTDYYSRFKLVFATGNNGNDDNFAFFSNGSFVINNEGNAMLQVIDVNGRIIRSESINGCANVNVNAASGVYMLRLINGDNVKTQKVVVR